MKDLKISDTLTVKLAENLDELPIKRWTECKKWALMIQSGADFPNLKKYGDDFARAFDNQSHSQMYKVHYDWLYSLSSLDRGDDPDQFFFALITFEENEDKSIYDRNFLEEKLKRYNKAGLTQGTVKKEVENFMAGVLKL